MRLFNSILTAATALATVLGLTLSQVAPLDGSEALASYNDPTGPTKEAGTASGDPSWLEPRGLNIVDLVGLVPDAYLRGSIISFTPGYGIIVYESGSRMGKNVTIETRVFPRYVKDGVWSGSMLGCLGQPARMDQWGSVAPATSVRLYHGDEEVTSKVDLYSYVPAGRSLPVRNPKDSEHQNQYRYWERGRVSLLTTSFTSDGALHLPANMGCELIMSYTNYEELRAVFTARVEQRVDVKVMGSETFKFGAYLGPGYAGLMSELVDQLRAKYGKRHPKFSLDVPDGADYLLLNFPPTPVDPFTQFPGNPRDNVGRPSSGTYRVDGDGLSVDHVNSMGLPLYGHWRDADGPDCEYLSHFQEPDRLAAPEYFVPHGVEYDPCMLAGTCPDSLLRKIRETKMEMTVVYLRVERIADGMDQIALRMVGPEWRRATAGSGSTRGDGAMLSEDVSDEARASLSGWFKYRVHLPMIIGTRRPAIPPDQARDQPCGWFTADGRMLDFVRMRR